MVIIPTRDVKGSPCEKLSRPVAWTVSVAAILLSPHSNAAEWKIVPSINLRETYTDNVNLSPQGTKKTDFITEISPGISVTGSGPGLKVQAAYVMQNVLYANNSSNNATHHQLNADMNAELVNNLFFLDGNASISRQNISAFGAQSNRDINITNNTSEIRTYSISPYLSHDFGNFASSELRYTHDYVGSSTPGLLASQADYISFKLNSGTSFRTTGWGLQYHKQKVDQNSTDAVDNESYSANIHHLLSSRFSVNATVGYEKFSYLSLKEKPEGYFWTTGFSWAPTSRTNVMMTAGKRFYGNTYSLAANHRSRSTIWSLSYDEDITSTRSQFLLPATINTASFLNNLWASSIPDPVTRQQIVDTFLRDTGIPRALSDSVNSFTNRFFLQKRLQASAAFNSAKTTTIFSVFNTLREAQTSQAIDSALLGLSNLSLQDNTRQIGGNAILNWQISPRSSMNISAGYSRVNALATERVDRNKTFSIALTKQFKPDLRGTIEIRRLQQNSNQSNGVIRENAISASILMTL